MPTGCSPRCRYSTTSGITTPAVTRGPSSPRCRCCAARWKPPSHTSCTPSVASATSSDCRTPSLSIPMSQSEQRISFWRYLKDLRGRTPLRVKLTAAVLALVIAALALISFAGISYLRDYLVNRADSELQDLRGSTSGAYGLHAQSGFGPRVGEQPLIEAISPAGHAYPGPGFQLRNTDPKIPLSRSWLASNALQPTTVPAQAGGDRWRVIVQPGQPIALNNGQTFTGTIVVGLNVTDVYATIGRLIVVDLLVSLGIVLILTLIAAGVVRASLRPLIDIEKTAGAIAAGGLSRRGPGAGAPAHGRRPSPPP